MRTQIRLAERQGLLTGKGLSQVQVIAVSIRDVEDTVQRNERSAFEFKLALVAAGRDPADLFTVETRVDDDDDNADALTGDDPTVWQFTDDDYDPAEAERLIAELTGQTSFAVPGDQVQQSTERLTIDWGKS